MKYSILAIAILLAIIFITSGVIAFILSLFAVVTAYNSGRLGY